MLEQGHEPCWSHMNAISADPIWGLAPGFSCWRSHFSRRVLTGSTSLLGRQRSNSLFILTFPVLQLSAAELNDLFKTFCLQMGNLLF